MSSESFILDGKQISFMQVGCMQVQITLGPIESKLTSAFLAVAYVILAYHKHVHKKTQ